ncbi:MAG TPA: helix-turn-helix domain-containing protein [Candidatus Nanoarchaeia archaeon]|nr:helix-turn-helix domain-containing protein [Candidatus Nanoarchaeia archaeon]
MEIPFLTAGESRVYEALTELGESPIGNIIKLSKVSHSKIYDILKRLSDKGLVSSINKNGRQHFSAASPEALSHLVAEQNAHLEMAQKRMSEVIDVLKVKKNISTPKSVLSAYEGMKSMKAVLDYVITKLGKNDEILILGSPKSIGENLGGYLRDWQKRRLKTGAVCKIISDVDAPSWNEDWWKKSKARNQTFSKRSKSVSPAYLVITKDSVTTIYFSSKILTFIIEHEDVASRYIEFFNDLWRHS